VIPQRLAANAGAFVAAALFGASVVAVRVAVQDVPPLSLAVLRFGQGGLLLVVVLLLVGGRGIASSTATCPCSCCSAPSCSPSSP